MSIEDIIRAWKADEEALEPDLLVNPAGEELSEEELLQVLGGRNCEPGTDCNTGATYAFAV